MPTVISVEHLSKAYRLGQIGTGTFTYDLALWWAKLRGAPNPLLRIGETDQGNRDGETLWALKDVSFTVEQGEVLGIIGRNGAGKSTLLKILSRVTAPTSGRIKVKGRIASLLEVGTGFHPDLTGRENIYLNGALLGMNRKEIDRKLDEIVDFAEVEKFIDTPVKRYSSGMYVRLAFAVAAHLEPEILVVDEVLAVGDAEFQKKCLGKMGDVAHEGRTVIFVSHNMGAIAQLCEKCLLLQSGQVVSFEQTEKVIEQYMTFGSGENSGVFVFDQITKKSHSTVGFIERLEVMNQNNVCTSHLAIGEPFTARVHIHLRQNLANLSMGIEFTSSMGIKLLNLRSDSQGISFGPYEAGQDAIVNIRIPGLPMYPGLYKLSPWIAEKGGKRIDYIQDGINIHLESKGHFQSEQFIQHERGIILLDCDWNEEAIYA